MQTHPALPMEPEAPPRKRRRWWFYALIGLGVVVGLAIAVFIGLVSYYHKLIRDYTTTTPLPLAPIEATAADRQAIKDDFTQFFREVQAGRPTQPFQVSEQDLNVLMSEKPDLNGHVRLSFLEGRVRAEFSFPLDKGNHKKELKGRFLNGVALLEIKLAEDGFPSLKVKSIQANGKPAPGWLQSLVKKKDVLEDLYRQPYLLQFLNGIDDITVAPGQLTVTPINRL